MLTEAALLTEIKALVDENEKLKSALLLAIPWIGVNAEGPIWAAAEAKKKNRVMCEQAFEAATNCFPESSVFCVQ